MYCCEILGFTNVEKCCLILGFTDLLIDISNGDIVCSIFDKRDAFDFHIVNFSDLSGNIPTAPAYGTYISQLIIYSWAWIIMTTFFLGIPCLQIDFSSRSFCKKTDENVLKRTC